MTRLFTCGWETGRTDDDYSTASGSWIAQGGSPAPKSPSVYHLRPLSAVTKTWTFDASKTEIYVRFHVYNQGGYNAPFMFLQDSAGGSQCNLAHNGPTGFLSVYPGNATTGAWGTSALFMAINTWHLIEMRYKASSTASATDGIVQVWQDGNLVIDFTGDTITTTNVNVQRFLFNAPNGDSFYFDDLAINDTIGLINNSRIGEGSVVFLKPNGAGSSTTQTRGGTDSGSNWNQVNEIPYSFTDYVYADVGDGTKRDLYTLDDIPAGTWTVNHVEVIGWAQNGDVGVGSIGLTTKSGATIDEQPPLLLGITPSIMRKNYEVDPNTGAAWTNANVNALEVGTTVR